MMRIGLIQTRGIGDIIIAMPIAQFLISKGHEVIWPVDARFLPSLQSACGSIQFRPVRPPNPAPGGGEVHDYYVGEPLNILQREHCEIIHVLYSKLACSPKHVANPELGRFLKFDEYKYAIAGVPFAKKWCLTLERNEARERRLLDQVAPGQPYVVVHTEGSGASIQMSDMESVTGGLPVVQVAYLTDSIFDWLLVIQGAAHLVMIDSCFANLVDQLNMAVPKHLLLRTPLPFTPVFRSGWSFIAPSRE
jgi:hypothetical protein